MYALFLVVSRKKGEGEVIQKAVSGLIRLASDPPGHSARHMSHVTVLIPAWPTSHHIHITPTQHQQEFTNTGLVKHSANNTSYFPHIFCEFDSFVYSSQQVIDIIRTRPGGSTNNSNTRHKNKFAQHKKRKYFYKTGASFYPQVTVPLNSFSSASVLRCPDPLRIC